MGGTWRRPWVAAAAALALVPLSSPASAGGSVDVDVTDNAFAPASVSVPVGGSVTWTWRATNAAHNVRQARRLFRSGDPTPTRGTTFSRVFSAGTFPYVCELHAGLGMRGTVRVPPRVRSRPDGPPFTVGWASASSNVGGVFDVRFKVGSGDWRTWFTDTSRRSAVFGKDGRPVTVRRGTTYRFRVRTQASAGEPRRRSGWSPVRAFTPS